MFVIPNSSKLQMIIKDIKKVHLLETLFHLHVASYSCLSQELFWHYVFVFDI